MTSVACRSTGAGMVSGGKALRGHGLTLLRERLATLYREEGTLQTDSSPGHGFTAWVRVPGKGE